MSKAVSHFIETERKDALDFQAVKFRRARRGVNDLQTKAPDIAAEWHPTKNLHLTPSDVRLYSNLKVWWMCKKGHEWIAKIANRTLGTGCPFCDGKYPSIGENDLATTYPEIAAEWHPSKNAPLMPSDVMPHSGKKFWWKCKFGHEWQATACHRTNSKSTGCPYCSGRYPIVGENDLATLFPVIAAEWHPEKNGDLTPSDVKAYSNRIVWWRCKHGHEWKVVISNRTLLGNNCPYCFGLRTVTGNNDLVTLFPEVAAEWHPSKNGNISPSNTSAFSNKKRWWLGKCGHEWKSVVSDRTIQKTGCPICQGRSKPQV